METIEESIDIKRNCDDVYALYFDIKSWPNVLSDVVDVIIYRNEEYIQNFEMKVIKYGSYETVHTLRKCVRNRWIELEQPSPPPQVEVMKGRWSFEMISPEITRVKGMREFEIKAGKDPELYKYRLRKSLKSNLLHFKNYLENVGYIDVSIIIKKGMKSVMDTFWDLEKWNSIWNPVLHTNCVFDNGFMQEFMMEVERNNAIEHITGIQLRREHSIDFYNILCPPKLAVHFGSWEFMDVEEGLVVTSKRIFKMDEKSQMEFLKYRINLRNRLLKILLCFNKYFEEG